MEYFKLYLSPDRGRLIAAPSRGGGGRGSREVAAPPATPFRPSGRTPSPGRTSSAGAETRGPGPPAEIRLRRAWHTARGARRRVKVAGAARRAGRTGGGPAGAGGGRGGRAKFDSRLICRGLLCFLLDMSPAPRALPAAASSPWRAAAGGGGAAGPRGGSCPRPPGSAAALARAPSPPRSARRRCGGRRIGPALRPRGPPGAAGSCRLPGSRADAAAAAALLSSMEPAGSARRTRRPRPGRSGRAGGACASRAPRLRARPHPLAPPPAQRPAPGRTSRPLVRGPAPPRLAPPRGPGGPLDWPSFPAATALPRLLAPPAGSWPRPDTRPPALGGPVASLTPRSALPLCPQAQLRSSESRRSVAPCPTGLQASLDPSPDASSTPKSDLTLFGP